MVIDDPRAGIDDLHLNVVGLGFVTDTDIGVERPRIVVGVDAYFLDDRYTFSSIVRIQGLMDKAGEAIAHLIVSAGE